MTTETPDWIQRALAEIHGYESNLEGIQWQAEIIARHAPDTTQQETRIAELEAALRNVGNIRVILNSGAAFDTGTRAILQHILDIRDAGLTPPPTTETPPSE